MRSADYSEASDNASGRIVAKKNTRVFKKREHHGGALPPPSRNPIYSYTFLCVYGEPPDSYRGFAIKS